MKKIYYPSSWMIDPFLYRNEKQVALEVDQLNNFINDWNYNQKLVISREVPYLFFIVIWLLALFTIPLPLLIVFIAPINIYFFNLQNKYLIVKKTTLFSS